VRRPPALVFDVPIADVTMAETIELINELVIVGRTRGTTHQVSTVNVDFLVNALEQPELADILKCADLCIADGMPVVWAARMLGMPIRERVAGSDLLPLLVESSQSTGHHVHIFGSSPEVASAASELLRERYPTSRFSVDPGPMLRDVEHVDEDVLAAIAAVDADVLCVALGNPKQERFINANRARLRTPVMIGIGGSLDMLVGKRRRAPRWVQVIGMEWVARAVQEPRRLGRRYAHDIRIFLPRLMRAWQASRARRTAAGLQVATIDSCVCVRVMADVVATVEDWQRAADAAAAGAPLSIDFAGMTAINDEALAQIVGLDRLSKRSGGERSLSGLDPALANGLAARGLLVEHFPTPEAADLS
jgi:N-acetylglucosaminyldiphosphoundecaprenol N-acetyl-beta-D-mannosaminyltransferase